MTGTPHTRTLLSIGLGLVLAAAITVFTFLAFEDIALAHNSIEQPAATIPAQR
jgi:hypothetical protein